MFSIQEKLLEVTYGYTFQVKKEKRKMKESVSFSALVKSKQRNKPVRICVLIATYPENHRDIHLQ